MAHRSPPDRTTNDLIVEGARQNNLKNISLRIPHNRVTAITGLSVASVEDAGACMSFCTMRSE